MPNSAWNNKNEKFIHKLNKLILESLSVTSADGIASILNTKRILIRFGWIFCWLTSLALCLYFICQTVFSFLDYEVVTSIDLINEQYTQFPTVSLCNSNGGFGNIGDIYSTEEGLKQSLLFCYFNGEKDCFHNPTNYFELYNDSMYGHCFRFNSGKNFYGQPIDILNSTIGGFQYGLVLMFNIGTNTFQNDFGQLMISIQNYTEIGSSLFNNEIFLSAGSSNDFILERKKVQKLGNPYNDCIYDLSAFKKNRTIVDYFISLNRSYSQKECLNICRNLKYIEKSNCNCSSELSQVTSECLFKSKASNNQIYECSLKFVQNFVKNSDDECSNYCPIECEMIIYDTSYNIERFPLKGNVTKGQFLVDAFDTYETIQQGFYSLRIYYKDLSFISISQQPKMELFDLISNIGGVLGLFLGLSFLSFAEIIIFLIEFLFILIKK